MATLPAPTGAPPAAAPATAARVAVPGPAHEPEAEAPTMGPVLPVSTGRPCARARRTGLRLGILAMTVVPTAIPTEAIIPAVLAQGMASNAVGSEGITLPQEAQPLRPALNEATRAALERRIRLAAIPSNGRILMAKKLLPRATRLARTAASAASD